VNINLVYKVTKLIIAVANDLAQSTSWLPIVPIYWGAIKAQSTTPPDSQNQKGLAE